MSRQLNPREKKLLALCLLAIFTVATSFAWGAFSRKRKALNEETERLTQERDENLALLQRRDYWDRRMNWLDTKMPYTDSALKSQGQLLEELRSETLDAELKITGETLLDSVGYDNYNEVAINLKVRGDQDRLLRWLLTLQSPEKFQVIKSLEIELDTKAKEKTPQAQCNLTIARWFNVNAPAGTPPPAPPPSTEDPSPLTSPSDGLNPSPGTI